MKFQVIKAGMSADDNGKQVANKYMGQFMDELPVNCVLNKTITGCGATTVAMESKYNYVIAVPYKSMIKNKLIEAKKRGIDMIGVYGKFTKSMVKNIHKHRIIMVTYDSLHKVTACIDASKYRLAVDESHNLVMVASYRMEAIHNVLSVYKKYGAYTFMSATPVPFEYQLDELNELEQIKIEWQDVDKVRFDKRFYKNNLNENVALECIKYLDGSIKGNMHIFINSVNSIVSIIKMLQNVDSKYANKIMVAVADSDKNDAHLEEVNIVNKLVGTVKKINFYTATAFEGSDIYDEYGKTYIVTNGSNDHTKYNIEVTIPQIIGRLRDSVYKNDIVQMYSSSLYFNYTSIEDYKQAVSKSIVKAKLNFDANIEDALAGEELGTVVLDALCDRTNYVIRLTGSGTTQYVINEAGLKQSLAEYSSLHTDYYVRKVAVTDAQGNIKTEEHKRFIKGNDGEKLKGGDGKYMTIKETSTVKERVAVETTEALVMGGHPTTMTTVNAPTQLDAISKVKLNMRSDFVALCKYYCETKSSLIDTLLADDLHLIELKFPLIYEAYDKLGANKMKALEYRKGALERALMVENTLVSNNYKFWKMLKYKQGQRYSCKVIAEDLNRIAQELGVNKKFTAKDIAGLATVKAVLVPKSSGYGRVKGYEIVLPKFINK